MASDERTPSQPPVNWVDTTAGGEHEPGDPAIDGSPGSGANEISRAGFPNADPDGYDVERSDLQGIDIGDSPVADRA